MSSEQAVEVNDIKTLILEDPKVVLNDRDLMRALIAADDEAMGENIVDLKTVVLKKLETRLNKMEEHQNSLLSAAYDNVAATTSIHKAVLDMLEPKSFSEFLEFLVADLARSLNIDIARLCLEAPTVSADDMATLKSEFGDGVVFLQDGEIDYYITLGRDQLPRPITLRPVKRGISKIHGDAFESIRSEALMKLDLGANNRPALLVLGSKGQEHFSPKMATDLLVFYGSVFERVLRNWLAND